jgi:AraC-like DNA-binding protein
LPIPAVAKFPLPQDQGSPPDGRPWWIDFTSDIGLFYLGWGLRYFGRNRLLVTKHSGWAYVVILQGTPSMDLADGSVRLKKRNFLLIHPDCASGWSDRLDATSEVLYWIWKQPPDPSLMPEDGGYRLGTLGTDEVDRLRLLHQACRREVQVADDLSLKALGGLRVQLDAELARALNSRAHRSDDTLRFALACEWMERNLSQRRAVTLLCEYLETSASALERLFRKCGNCTPVQFFSRLRMQRAHELVVHGKMSAKSAAFELGYKHANDLSRAFHRHEGKYLCRR